MKRLFIFILLLCLFYSKGIAQIYSSWYDEYGNIWKYEFYNNYPSFGIKIVSLDFSTPDYFNEIPDSIDGYPVKALGPIFKDKSLEGSITLPKTVIELDSTFQNCGISRIINTEQIESLQNDVFKNCANLDSINLPNCTDLGAYSGASSHFYGCNNLKSAKLPKTQKLPSNIFYGCTSLQNVDLKNVTSIWDGAFYGCTSLQNIDLGNVTFLGNEAFSGCTSLQDIDLGNVISIGQQAFSGCTSLQNVDLGNVTSIAWSVFSGCTSLQNIDLGNVTYIGVDAFSGCTSLQNIDLGNVTSIGWSAFYGCTSLQNIDLGNVTSIGWSAFSECTSLQNVELKNVTSIESKTFYGCTSLQSVDLENVISIEDGAFSGCTSLQNVDLGNVTSIGKQAFYGCTSLQDIDLGNVTSIGDQAFTQCKFLTKIENIDFPNCTKIGANVFTGLENIKEVNLAKCKTIGEGAFRSCNQLKDINIPNITSLGTDAFSDCPINQLSLPESIDTLGAQNIPHIVINATKVPTLFSRFENNIAISVPKESVNSYKNADVWKENAGQIFAIGTKFDYDVKTTAEANAPGLLQQLDRNNLNSIFSLKVSGTINGYDIMLFRNKMDNLYYLDLSDADIVANPYEYVEGHCTQDSILGSSSFSSLHKLLSLKLPNSVKIVDSAVDHCNNLRQVTLPKNLIKLQSAFRNCPKLKYVDFKSCEIIDGAFYECYSLDSLILPNNLHTINNYAFYHSGLEYISFPKSLKVIGEQSFEGCDALTSIIFQEGLESIGSNAFRQCKQLKTISFPPSLKSIGWHAFENCSSLDSISLPGLTFIDEAAFYGCSKLKELRIPSTLERIGNDAFRRCSLEKVYAYTVLPINISQDTFDNFSNIALYVPTQSVDNYYLNTQWSQFKEIHEFNEPYKYFYLDKEFTLDDKRFDGTPDIDIKQDGGLTVDGKDKQEAGDITIGGDADKGNSGTLITDGNVNAKKIKFEIKVSANKWYFFSFPFDIKFSDTKAPGEYKWKIYDGSIRADQGTGGWVDVDKNEEWLKQGAGYIFQTNQDGLLTLSVTKEKFEQLDANNVMTELDTYPSDNNFDASWNFIGNPQTSYFNVNDLDYQAPITVWNGSSYEAVRPGDDDYTLHPFEAFFVQKPTAVTGIEFKAEDRLTKTGSIIRAQEAKARRIGRGITPNRLIINLSVSDGTQTDKTRVVFNNQKSRDYEMDCDAAKFMTMTAAPQLYSIEGKGTKFAINERPAGSVQLGFSTKKAGTYTISAARMDQPMLLKDNLAGVTFDLTNGDYEFTSGAGTFNSRFMLIANGSVTGIADIINQTGVNIMPTDEGLSINGTNGKTVNVYNLNGMQVASRNTDGMLSLPTGVYIVKVEDMSTKVMVK